MADSLASSFFTLRVHMVVETVWNTDVTSVKIGSAGSALSTASSPWSHSLLPLPVYTIHHIGVYHVSIMIKGWLSLCTVNPIHYVSA